MTSHLANRLTLFSAAIALAACSSAQSQELPPADAPNIAVVTQGAPPLEAAPENLAEAPPPLVVPEAAEPGPLAPEQLTPQPLPPPPVVVAPVSLSCHIDIMRTANGVRITPVMLADRAMAGEYSLVITKSGPDGASDISQGGPFDTAYDDAALSASEISLERGAHLHTVLKIMADGRVICRDTVS